MHNFLTSAASGGSASCGHNSRFTGFRGSGGLREISRPRSEPELAVLAVTRRHRAVFGNFELHRNRVRVAQLSYIGDVGWCVTFFPAICDLLVFLGSPAQGG